MPGAPETGVAWATGAASDTRAGFLQGLGLAVTVLGGGIALLGPPLVGRPSRPALAAVGVVLVGDASGSRRAGRCTRRCARRRYSWAASLRSGCSTCRDSCSSAGPARGGRRRCSSSRWRPASSPPRWRCARGSSAADTTGGGEIGRDLGLWSMVFGMAGAGQPLGRGSLAARAGGAGRGGGSAGAGRLARRPPLHGRRSRLRPASRASPVFALLLLAGRLGGRARGSRRCCDLPALVALPAGSSCSGSPRGGRAA